MNDNLRFPIVQRFPRNRSTVFSDTTELLLRGSAQSLEINVPHPFIVRQSQAKNLPE